MVETTKPDMIMVTGDITSERENLESLPNCIYEAGDEAVDGIFILCRSEAERLSTLKMTVLLQLRILSVTEGRIQLQSAKSNDFMLNC